MKWHLAYVDWLILDVSCLKNLVSSRASFCIDRFKSNYTQAIYWQSVEIENHNFLSWYLEVCPVKMQKCVLKWDRKYDLIYMKDSEIGPVPQTCPIILWRQISMENPKTSLIPLWCQTLPNMSDSVPQTCPILQRNNIILPSYACLQFCPCFSVITIL